MPLLRSIWCGRRSSPESLSSTEDGALSASAERRMPRREGEVLRLGTATGETPIQRRAARPEIAKARLLHAIKPQRQPLEAPSGRSAGFERGERNRLARVAIGPQDELERLIIGLTGVERGLDYGAALRVARASAPRQAQGVAKHHHVLLAPLVEMPKPQLFVDELRQFADRRAFVRRRLEVERAADMQRFELRQPGEGDVVIGEPARDQD